jgi:hypothetical protein
VPNTLSRPDVPDYLRLPDGGLPFCDGANVSGGQFNQSGIEILFGLPRPGRRSAERLKALGCLFRERFSTKEPRAKLQDNRNVFNESLANLCLN